MAREKRTLGGQEALALLTFNDGAEVTQRVELCGDVLTDQARELAEIFLASASIAEALLSPEEGSGRPRRNGKMSADSGNISKSVETTVVSLDEDGVLTATPVTTPDHEWLCLVINPLILHDSEVVEAMLPCLIAAARDLDCVVSSDAQAAYSLLNSISDLLRSGNWWSREKRLKHAKKALIGLAESFVYKDRLDQSAINRISAEEERLKSSLSTFQTAVAEESHHADTKFCVVSADETVIFTYNMTESQSRHSLWYYTSFVSIGSRASARNVVEQRHSPEVTRLWYQWRGWRLCALLAHRISKPPQQSYSRTSRAAFAMLRAFHESSKS